jgi:hypothetical protein
VTKAARWQDSVKANQVPLGGVYATGYCVFRFLPGWRGLKGCTMTNTKALAHIVPDKTYPGMWRVVRPDGSLSDMVNKTRAKDVAWRLAENAVYLGNAA